MIPKTESVPALVLMVGLSVAACSDSPTTKRTSTCMTAGPLVQIVDNHLLSGGDHQLVVTAGDVVAAVERTYDIRGDNVGHTHFVTLAATDFVALQEDEPVTVLSSNNETVGIGHDHTIQLTCP